MNAIATLMFSGAAHDVPQAAGTPGKTANSAKGEAKSLPFAMLVEALVTEGTQSAEGKPNELPVLADGVSLETADRLPEGDAEPKETDWHAVLELLASAFPALPPELQEHLASLPEVKAWTALVNAELAMAGEEPLLDGWKPAEGTLHKEAGRPMPETGLWDTPRIGELAVRLVQAAKAHPESTAFSLAVEQGVHVIAKALQEAAGSAGGNRAVLTELQAMTASVLQQQVLNKPATASERGKLAQLLHHLDAHVETAKRPLVQEGTAAQARSTLLAAMEAKAGWNRFALTAEAGRQTAGELKLNGFPAVQSPDESSASIWNGFDSLKATLTSGGAKGEPAVQNVPIHHFFDHVSSWFSKKIAGAESVRTETLIRLVPEHLGSVEVKLVLKQGQLTASIITESAMAKEVLEQNLAVLRTNLQQAGVIVERLSVTQQQPAAEMAGMNQDGRQQQSSSREQRKDPSEQRQTGHEDWLDLAALGEELEEIKLAALYGNSFQAEA